MYSITKWINIVMITMYLFRDVIENMKKCLDDLNFMTILCLV